MLNNPPSPTTPLGDIVRETGCPLTLGIWVSLDTVPASAPFTPPERRGERVANTPWRRSSLGGCASSHQSRTW